MGSGWVFLQVSGRDGIETQKMGATWLQSPIATYASDSVTQQRHSPFVEHDDYLARACIDNRCQWREGSSHSVVEKRSTQTKPWGDLVWSFELAWLVRAEDPRVFLHVVPRCKTN